jgi:hypothetical protein
MCKYIGIDVASQLIKYFKFLGEIECQNIQLMNIYGLMDISQNLQ